MAMGVGATDGEGVFLGEAEAGGCFAGAGEDWRVVVRSMGAEEVEEGGCSDMGEWLTGGAMGKEREKEKRERVSKYEIWKPDIES